MIHYYLTIFPMEALIASQLDAHEFGVYMATGTRRGSAERLIFIELKEGGFGDDFDWAYAEESCQRATDEGSKRHSAYLAVYRVLERIPLDKLGRLHLVTRDGRDLALDPAPCQECGAGRSCYLYQELCPARPLVISSEEPCAFIEHITDPGQKISMPAVAIADMAMVDDLDTEDPGNIRYHNIGHLKDCVASLRERTDKAVKVVDRSTMDNFGFGAIDTGIYIGAGKQTLKYAMPDRDTLLREHYEWARSTQLI